MAIIMGSGTVPASTTGTFLLLVPPGAASVTLWNQLNAQTVYVGTGTLPTLGGSAPHGIVCPTVPTAISTFNQSQSTIIYAATAGTASTFATNVQYILSTNA